MAMKERELPLNALRAFAAAARSANLTAAAQQLGVTYGAVSKQISVLEEWIGQKLFVRQGRGLALSPYGEILAERVEESLGHIGAACDYIRRDRARRVISVEAPTTFALHFLLPRLKAFEEQQKNVSVWISTRMTGQPPDFSRHDVVITRGAATQGTPRSNARQLLFEEKLTPVGAASLLRTTPVRKASDILKHRLIASSSRPGEWQAWLGQAGVKNHGVQGGHNFDHLFVALHAVRDGFGLTIAPRIFFAGPRSAKGLRCPLPDLFVPGQPNFAYATRSADKAESFVQWLCEECQEGGR
jgi:LysR family transcriptional regulator, glycine cleavage system transcriptional activator